MTRQKWCIVQLRLYGVTNIELFNRLKTLLVSNNLPTDEELLKTSVSEGFDMQSAGLVPTFDFLDDEAQVLLWKKQMVEQLNMSPTVALLSPAHDTVEKLDEIYNKYLLLNDKFKRISNGYSLDFWGYNVPNMYIILKDTIAPDMLNDPPKMVHRSTVGSTKEQTVKALAFGHLVNRYINAYVGKLAAVCSCCMASSTAACAGMTWLLGGNDEQIGYAVRNMTGTITGMICDGGKVGCAMKVATSSVAALTNAMLAVNNVALRASDGICADTPEQCVKNIGQIANPGMIRTDKEILDIMMKK